MKIESNALLIDGNWVQPATGGSIPMIDPCNGEAFAHIATGEAEDLEIGPRGADRLAGVLRAGAHDHHQDGGEFSRLAEYPVHKFGNVSLPPSPSPARGGGLGWGHAYV
jgi:hypothetical protein